MSSGEHTQYQSDEDRGRSRDLSLAPSKPPTAVTGYSIEQFLGKGAYGEVWSGTEKKTGRRVAIKFYTRKSSDDVEQISREVEKLVALAADRYAVQLVDVDWQATPPYYVMDYFERGSLEDLLKQQTRLPVSEAEDIFIEIATGLMHLHGKGIFHCDLKPANILLDQDNKPRLADFGQSRLATDDSPSLGTLFYMAPEQADLNVVPAAKWDVFALGSIFYAMLVGKPPYQHEALSDQLQSSKNVESCLLQYRRALKAAQPPNEHRRIAGVDRALADIIDQAIDPNPNQRFDSVQSVMFAMRQRESAKARKPLMLLGILGPLLLMMVMSIFSWITYDRTYNNTLYAINEEAKQTNAFAAKLASRSASAKISEYFRFVEDLANDSDFIQDLSNAVNDTQLIDILSQLDDPNVNADEDFESLRIDFRDLKFREKLQTYMDQRIRNADGRLPNCASWFVNDRRGNQLASAFATEPATNTIGRNYSYRSYFSGDDRDATIIAENGDLEYDVPPLGTARKIITAPHLSAVFRSKGTSTWKVAFSAPVRNAKNEIIGIVACTAEMGKFIELDFGSPSQYATLIDGRPGDNTGAILEHPFFHESEVNPELIPKVDDIAKIEQELRFRDPIAKLPSGEHYDREWLAAINTVEIKRSPQSASPPDSSGSSERSKGLFVLVAEDAQAVFAPVENLGTQLIWLAVYALLFFALVAGTMWLLVLRLFKDSSSPAARSFSSSNDSTLATQPNSHKKTEKL